MQRTNNNADKARSVVLTVPVNELIACRLLHVRWPTNVTAIGVVYRFVN